MKPNIERRTVTAEIRRTGKKQLTATGYAALYNEQSEDLGGFVEIIRPGAFDAALTRSDVRALLNHDQNMILGRLSAETLRLESDARGLRYEIDLPDTTYAHNLRASLDRGDITQSSFAFTVAREEWETEPDGSILRHIHEVEYLYDVAPVTYPAYAMTEARAAVASLNDYYQRITVANRRKLFAVLATL